ncbi:Photosystem I assembly factor PSA3, chloroplastic, partial [Mucuna pruriens]
MVVLKSTSPLSSLTCHFFNLSSSSKIASPHSLRHHHVHPARPTSRVAHFAVRAYIENPNSLGSFVNRVIGALPVVGLIARILSNEGGVGDDLVDFAEFRRRVGNKCSDADSTAFYDFQDRRGRQGDPLYVLLCCWLAAIGAGLLKTEDILEGVTRLRISNDIEFEEQKFMALMNEAKERRAKLKAEPPAIPMEIRAAKALDAIYVCCFGKDSVEEEDERLLTAMLSAVFPSVRREEIQRLIKDKAEKVAAGVDEDYVSELKPLSKEAVEIQMKDLQFLQQNILSFTTTLEMKSLIVSMYCAKYAAKMPSYWRPI